MKIRIGPQVAEEYGKAALFGIFVLVCIPIALVAFPFWCVGKGVFIIEAALDRRAN